MKTQSGFTMLEILAALAIVGILTATAVPLYHTWQGRAYGSEASIMLRQIIGAEINYFLENDKFFPDNNVYIIPHEGQPQPTDIDVIKEIFNNLHITINQGHFLEYGLSGGLNEKGKQVFVLTIRSRNGDFDIFKGAREIWATLDKDGNAEFVYPNY
jgi:prepilin-type N-terminal cleavage/methylation domain-containing protein